MKKICFVTAARSEYGLLKWLMREVEQSPELELQLVVTGGHLLKEQGYTMNQIVEDGFKTDAVVDANLDTSTSVSIANSMGRMMEGFSKAFQELNPDYVVVLGDRYELLAICSTAFVMRIPIIHISGGDVTEGAIDDGIRNAVTMLADYHFPGTEDSKNNIIRMRNTDKNIWAVGELGLDAFFYQKLLSRRELAENLNLEFDKKWILMTYHSETKESLEYNLRTVKYCVELLKELKGYQIVVTYSNADFGGKQINEWLENAAKDSKEKLTVVPSLGSLRYLSFMRQVEFVIGNSSSGIVEAPILGIPVINIGNRQKGRYQCRNIIQCTANKKDIKNSIYKAIHNEVDATDSDYWGDGGAAKRILKILEKEL